ncbi:Uncharacterised protein [Sphingobacterium spiritivorum]|uniref:Uncharacterized protein n=1 Tax=Sphingobacterium spiritivorum TaxID=258 RepID=A0A380CPM2_SPHSI|nr:hypothetical protein [Sphingobacterium spiritivorum]SUJ25709.1 Uncharacterised protein [Sphingobacterium spiritivorum]
MNRDLVQLEEEILAPSAALIADIKRIEGDIMLLGIGAKWVQAWADSLCVPSVKPDYQKE